MTLQEPFICVSIGGHKIPGADLDTMMVWAVTAQGRVNKRIFLSFANVFSTNSV